MIKIIEKSRAEGRISAPTSKSIAHRLLISAAMVSGEKSIIRGITPSEDVLATIDCLKSLGVEIEYVGGCAVVWGIDFSLACATERLYCRESGSTLRFLIPLCLISGNEIVLSGREKLISRPHSVYEEIAKERGFLFEKNSDSIRLCGRLKCGEYSVRGDVSSQFISGLIFALSTLPGESRIILTEKIESRSYIDLTIDALKQFGASLDWEGENTIRIDGGRKLSSVDMTVEGDWSGAAFLEALNRLGSKITIDGMNDQSKQGDRVCKEYFDALSEGYCEIDIEDCPDLGPILFAFSAAKYGGKFTSTKRLRIKESDRVEAMRQELSKFGIEMEVEENSVTVPKGEICTPKEILQGHNDHRIVMSLAVLCSLVGGQIEGCEAVKKSYPSFFFDLSKLGVKNYDTE